jgi:ferredoxin-NADP reductase
MQTVMGMLRFLRETNDQRPVIVLHISRPDESRLCQKEIDRMPRHIRYCRVERALDGQREGCGPCLSKKDLEAHYRKFWPGAHVFLCGPASMVEQLRPLLLELGVRERRICPEITPDNCISEAAAHR